MIKKERALQTFKKGDILSPFSDVKSSNGLKLENISKVKVIRIDDYDSSLTKQFLNIKILEYKSKTKPRDNSHWVYSNAFEHFNKKLNYEIF